MQQGQYTHTRARCLLLLFHPTRRVCVLKPAACFIRITATVVVCQHACTATSGAQQATRQARGCDCASSATTQAHNKQPSYQHACRPASTRLRTLEGCTLLRGFQPARQQQALAACDTPRQRQHITLHQPAAQLGTTRVVAAATAERMWLEACRLPKQPLVDFSLLTPSRFHQLCRVLPCNIHDTPCQSHIIAHNHRFTAPTSNTHQPTTQPAADRTPHSSLLASSVVRRDQDAAAACVRGLLTVRLVSTPHRPPKRHPPSFQSASKRPPPQTCCDACRVAALHIYHTCCGLELLKTLTNTENTHTHPLTTPPTDKPTSPASHQH